MKLHPIFSKDFYLWWLILAICSILIYSIFGLPEMSGYEKHGLIFWTIGTLFTSLIFGSIIYLIYRLFAGKWNNTLEKLYLSEIDYIDYNKDYMKDRSTMYPFIHKHKAYHFEEELRLIYTVNFGSGLTYDWSKEKNEYGKYITVNLNYLIDEIVISPYASNWFIDLVKDLCEKFKFNIEIKKSELAK